MKTMKRMFTRCWLLGLILGACSPLMVDPLPTNTAEQTSDPFDGTRWELLFLRKTQVLPGTSVTAAFEQGRVSGSAGCNTYSTSYQASGEHAGSFAINDLTYTKIACSAPAGIMAQE